MRNVPEPVADAFFASNSGVCVYVTLKGRAIRVCFESLDGAGITAEESSAAADAVAIATSAFRKHQLQLAPLFVTIAGIKAKRAGPQQPNGSSRP